VGGVVVVVGGVVVVVDVVVDVVVVVVVATEVVTLSSDRGSCWRWRQWQQWWQWKWCVAVGRLELRERCAIQLAISGQAWQWWVYPLYPHAATPAHGAVLHAGASVCTVPRGNGKFSMRAAPSASPLITELVPPASMQVAC
jgi:hypothetical protein